ncbi:MAG: DUF952 domain-containing protein [Polyangiales bacterium]
MTTVYRVLPRDSWEAARVSGAFHGSSHDLRDGFIHFSTAEQLPGTLRSHYAREPDLVLLYVELEAISEASAWRWEPSRGGALFPHLYAPLPAAAVRRVEPLPLGPDGIHQLPEL